MKKHLKLIAALAVVALAAIFLMNRGMHGVFDGKPDTTHVGVKGAELWDRDDTVGVNVPAGAVGADAQVTFTKKDSTGSDSPLDAPVQVIDGPVDIAFSTPVKPDAVEVKFKFDRSKLPKSAAGQSSDANVGIQVYNEDLGAWFPLQTEVKNGEAAALAPHFSLYRLVVLKLGEYAVNVGHDVKFVVDAATKPVELFGKVTLGLVQDFFRSALGQFDEAKFKCDPKDTSLRPKVSDDLNQKFDACAVKSGDESQLVLKNGYAFPMKVKSGVDGIRPVFNSDDPSLAGIMSQLGSTMTGDSSLGGLDIARLSVGPKAPQSFTISSNVDWGAAMVDIASSALWVLFPEAKAGEIGFKAVLADLRAQATEYFSKSGVINLEKMREILTKLTEAKQTAKYVANQAGATIETLDCALQAGTAANITSWDQAASTMVGTAQKCVKTVLANFSKAFEADKMLEVLTGLASDAKVLPEIGQLTAVVLLDAVTGGKASKFKVDVSRPDPVLEPLVGTWYSHDHKLQIDSDYTGEMVYTGSTGGLSPLHIKLMNKNGKPDLVFDALPPGSVGDGEGSEYFVTYNSSKDTFAIGLFGNFCGHNLTQNPGGCDADLDKFVGEWGDNRSHLKINADHTGELDFASSTTPGQWAYKAEVHLKMQNGGVYLVADQVEITDGGSPHQGEALDVYITGDSKLRMRLGVEVGITFCSSNAPAGCTQGYSQ